MSRRPANSTPMVSLFTFMDSLVCTMGALILMMLWITHSSSTGKLKIKDETKSAPTKSAPVAVAAPVAVVKLPPPVLVAKPIPVAVKTVILPPAFEEAIPSQIEGSDVTFDPELAAEQERVKQMWEEKIAAAEQERDQYLLRIRSERKQKAVADERRRKTEAEILLTREQLATLEAEREELKKSKTSSQSELDKLLQRIANTRRSLDLLKKKQAEAKSEFAIVPYDGASGTRRRPLYIECTDHGFHILPEDVWIKAKDLKGFSERLNPLLVGVTTLNDYWTQHAQARQRQADPQSPYVLLIVRPTGTMAYYVARKLLSSFRGESGYELVEEDWKLSVPDSDPTAKAILQRSLEETYALRDKRLRDDQEIDDSSLGESGSYGRLSRRSRGGVAESVGSIVQDRPGGALRHHGPGDSVTEISRRSRELPQRRELTGRSARGYGGAAQSSGSIGESVSDERGNPVGDGPSKAGLNASEGLARAPARSGTGSNSDSGEVSDRTSQPNGKGRGGSLGVPGDSMASTGGIRAARGWGSRTGTAGQSGGAGLDSGFEGEQDQQLLDLETLKSDAQEGSYGSADRGAPGGSRSRSSTSLPTGIPEPLIASTFGGRQGGGESRGNEIVGAGASEPLDGTSAAASASANDAGSDSTTGTGQSGYGGSGDSPGIETSDSSASGSIDDPAHAGPGGRLRTGLMPPDDTSPQGVSSGSGGSPGEGDASASPSGGSSIEASSTGSRPGGRSRPDPVREGIDLHPQDTKGRATPYLGEQEDTFSGMSARKSSDGESGEGSSGTVQFNFGANDQAGSRSRRGSRGKSWTGLRGRRGIGFEKQVEIHVLEDRLLVGPNDATVQAGRGESRTELAQRVLFGIEAVSESWGTPPQNFYYIPKVHFKIYPGGSQHYERVHPTLREQGIESTAEYALDGKPGKPSRGGAR